MTTENNNKQTKVNRQNPEARERNERVNRKSSIIVYLTITAMVLYFLQSSEWDAFFPFAAGTVDYWINGVHLSGWESSVRASIETFEWVVMYFSLGSILYLAKQKAV